MKKQLLLFSVISTLLFSCKDSTKSNLKTEEVITHYATTLIDYSNKVESLKDKNNRVEVKYCINELETPLKEAIYPYSIILINKKYNKNIHYFMH